MDSSKEKDKTTLRFGKFLGDKYLPKKSSHGIKKLKSSIYFAEYRKDYNSIYLEIISPPPEV